MANEDRSLRATHEEAEQKREALSRSSHSSVITFQENLLSAIDLYEKCLNIADRISLFSPNESLEDVSTADLQYLLLNYRIAELILRLNNRDRKATLNRAQKSYERFLRQLDNYDMLSKGNSSLLEQYMDGPTTFSIVSTSDAAVRRDIKIKRFKEEKALQEKLEYMRRNQAAIQQDDSTSRELQLTNIEYCTHEAFQSLESIAQELHILSLAPQSLPTSDGELSDPRENYGSHSDGRMNGYSERLDISRPQLSAAARGPLLDSKGKPLRPFTLTSKRTEFQNGVFRPDHSLPTMTIDEYLEEERRRGGIIDGGGPQSQVKPQIDEDDMEAADRETMKAREWDEFVEANPKGSGNTLNRG